MTTQAIVAAKLEALAADLASSKLAAAKLEALESYRALGGGIAAAKLEALDQQLVVPRVAAAKLEVLSPPPPLVGLVAAAKLEVIAQNVVVSQPKVAAAKLEVLTLLPFLSPSVIAAAKLEVLESLPFRSPSVLAAAKIEVLTSIATATLPPYNPGNFPPSGITTQSVIIPSYLYEQYQDDDALQALVYGQNIQAQTFINTINALNLSIYTGSNIIGPLLDWVGYGLYGLYRPTLAAGTVKIIAGYNSAELNTQEYDGGIVFKPPQQSTTDDIYKRILTWHLYRGDGRVFSVRWLKRRIMRFLFGANGAPISVDQTNQISVTFGAANTVAVRFVNFTRTFTTGSWYDGFELNSGEYNFANTAFTQLTPLPNQAVFQEALQTGALELPFQFSYTVDILG